MPPPPSQRFTVDFTLMNMNKVQKQKMFQALCRDPELDLPTEIYLACRHNGIVYGRFAKGIEEVTLERIERQKIETRIENGH